MFALSYSAPEQPDPNQRDAYFIGQSTGWNQMAEVAQDRNEKRRIELSRQQLELARQQEARVARDNQVANQLEARRVALAEKAAPIAAMERMLSLKKTAAETEEITRSLSNESRFVDLAASLSRAATTPTTLQAGPAIPSIATASGGAVRESLIKQQEPVRVQETQAEKLAKMSMPATREVPITEPPRIVEAPQEQIATRTVENMLKQIESRSARKLEEEQRDSAQAAKERERAYFATAPQTTWATGFGVSDNRIGKISPLTFEEGVDWGNL